MTKRLKIALGLHCITLIAVFFLGLLVAEKIRKQDSARTLIIRCDESIKRPDTYIKIPNGWILNIQDRGDYDELVGVVDKHVMEKIAFKWAR